MYDVFHFSISSPFFSLPPIPFPSPSHPFSLSLPSRFPLPLFPPIPFPSPSVFHYLSSVFNELVQPTFLGCELIFFPVCDLHRIPKFIGKILKKRITFFSDDSERTCSLSRYVRCVNFTASPSCFISHKTPSQTGSGGEPVTCDCVHHTTWVA